MKNELANVLVKTPTGWVMIFENIPEDKAQAIWKAGFDAGENVFSIETAESRRIQEMNRKALGQ